jgi:hypothetical protein
MAAQQFHNAGKYQDLGQAAANRADPFGQYRQYYGDKLRSLYDDPSQIENTPGYKFALNQGLDATQSRLASQGFLGSSQMQDALVKQASGLAQQTYNTEADRLSKLAGSQFDPANAGSFLMKGGELGMQAQSNALGAMFYPFGPGAGGTNVSVNGGGGSNGSGGGTSTAARVGQQAMGAIAQGGQAGFQAASQLLSSGVRFISNPDGTTTDLQAYLQHGADNGSGDTVPYYPRIDPNDPNSGQFYNPTVPDYTNDTPAPTDYTGININDSVPLDPLNPYGDMNFSLDPWS